MTELTTPLSHEANLHSVGFGLDDDSAPIGSGPLLGLTVVSADHHGPFGGCLWNVTQSFIWRSHAWHLTCTLFSVISYIFGFEDQISLPNDPSPQIVQCGHHDCCARHESRTKYFEPDGGYDFPSRVSQAACLSIPDCFATLKEAVLRSTMSSRSQCYLHPVTESDNSRQKCPSPHMLLRAEGRQGFFQPYGTTPAAPI